MIEAIKDWFFVLVCVVRGSLGDKSYVVPEGARMFLRIPCGALSRRVSLLLKWWGFQLVAANLLDMMPNRTDFVEWDGSIWTEHHDKEWKDVYGREAHFYFASYAL